MPDIIRPTRQYVAPEVKVSAGVKTFRPTIIPEDFCVIIDTREQTPYKFPSNIKTVVGTLGEGDYAPSGFQDFITIERKSQHDFYSSITNTKNNKNRDRLERMFERTLGMEFVGLVIDCSEGEILMPETSYSGISPASVYGTIVAFELKYNVHVYYGTREQCANKVLYWLSMFHRIKRGV